MFCGLSDAKSQHTFGIVFFLFVKKSNLALAFFDKVGGQENRPRSAREAPRRRPGAPRSAQEGSGAPCLGWIGLEANDNYDFDVIVLREINQQDPLAG